MNRRAVLLGIGIGIIIGASMMKLGTSSPAQSQPAAASPVVADEPALLEQPQVEQWLQENGYAFVKQSDWEAQTKRVAELENGAPAPIRTTIYINPGLSVSGIEHMLVTMEVLPEQNQFRSLIAEQGLTKKVRTGFFTFEGPQTEQSIIQQITKQ
ncbi:hypothetical protein BEP19_07375 [Ammoniphilus oxalaticus]|uniref:Uncharacterized protein n=1 Tax=Ammoniphilus oxalaticus TaxID=66863 RepID=A0A419SJQ8_9BACL|nr:hypothetical protein [Ammoniphilus oxalaticus]RKD24217.1 hypothetical protein BEP19_07375 [Ammoniphilus oxalaticus]